MPSQRQSQALSSQVRPAPSQRTSSGPRRVSTGSSGFPSPISTGKDTGSSIGALEAEYFGTLILIFLTVFTDSQSSYSSKMLAVMKRATLASVLFFILALASTSGPNAQRFAKAIGALVLVAIFLGTAGQGTISALDAFFKADWTSGDTTQGDSSAQAPAGTQIGAPDSVANLGAEAATVPGNIISETIDGAKVVISVPKAIGDKAISIIKGLIP
jgi:hypothetical protein